MNLRDSFIKAKQDNKIILKRSYFNHSISWQDVLNFVYKESDVEDVQDRNKNIYSQVVPEGNLYITIKGNISVHHPLWIKSLSGKLWEEIPELKDFLIKLNKDFNSYIYFDQCEYYDETYQRNCTCDSAWHTEGMVVSLASRLVSEHRDVFDAGYIQLLGKSFWKIEGEAEVCVLEPGDLILLPNELTHEVWGDGPRAGVLLYLEENNK